MSKKKPPLRLEYIEAGSLTENPGNWRRHPPAQVSALKETINDPEIGWAGAVLYNERTKRLVDGHARRDSVPPETPIPVLIGSWSEEAERKILLTLDPVGQMATADEDALKELMESVEFESVALTDVVSSLRDELGIDDAETELKQLATQPPPVMTWILIGIPTVRFGEIAETVERVAGSTASSARQLQTTGETMGFNARHQDGTVYWHATTPGEGLDVACGGTRTLHCYCGGDFCVCGNFGEVECPGCEDCDGDLPDDHDDYFEDDEYTLPLRDGGDFEEDDGNGH